MRKIYILCLLTCLLFFNSFGQSILSPNDSVITYNSASKPAQPAFGTIGKWVCTKKLLWNTDEYKCYIYKGSPFRLHYPKTYNPSAKDGKKYPVLVFFHGLGEADTSIYDNEYQLYHGGDVFQAAVDDGKFDGYVLAMQSGGFWGSEQVQYISEILDYMIANNKVNPFAISVNGLSAGGQGAWEMLFSHPDYVAACVPMSAVSASYTNQDSINKIKFIPVWDIQGGQDGSPAPYTAHLVRDAMLNAGADFSYTEFSSQGHDTWDSTWLLPDFFPYLLRAYSSNPWALFGKTKFCPGESINVTIGLAPGFQAYQWRYNGNIISGATSKSIHITQPGTYDARVKRNGIWSGWSRTPIKIIVQTPAVTPAIKVSGLMSTALPGADGNNFVNLKVSGKDTYTSYKWKKVGSDSLYSTQPVFAATEPGYYIVNALPQDACSSIYSPAFKVIDAKGPGAPNTVKSLTANALSDTKTLLEWSPFTQQANPPFAFEIYRGTTSGSYVFAAQIKSSVTVFRDTGLIPKTKYYYAVRAIDSTGAAPLSGEVSISTYSDTTAPSIPANLYTTYTTPSTISISWKASTDNVGIDHYNIYVNNSLKNSTKQTSFTLTSLVKNKSYAIYVKAVDGSNNMSAASNQISSEPILGGLKYSYYKTLVPWVALPDFTLLTPHKTGVSPNVDVNVASQNILNGFLWQGYIRIPVSGTYTFKTTSDDGSALWFNSYMPVGKRLVDNDGTHGTTSKRGTINITAGIYPICIEYFHDQSAGNMSVSWSCAELFGDTIQRPVADSFFNGVYVNAGSVPVMPGKLLAKPTAYDKINLTWQDNSNDETGFEIYRSTSLLGTYKIVATVKANTTAYNDSTLAYSKKYYYKIQTINQYGNSGLSAPDSATTFDLPNTPNAPSNFTAVAVSSSQIALSWNKVTNAAGYQLLRSIGDSLNYILLTALAADAASYSDKNLSSNLTYYYKIKAEGNGGTLSEKSLAFATTKDHAPIIVKLNTIKVPYGVSTTIPLTAADADGDLLYFKEKKLPPFASIYDNGNDTASLIINPLQANLGSYDNLNIIVKDPYGSKDSTVFKLIVNSNFAPTIDSIANYTLNENDSINIPLTAHDQNSGDVLKWSVLHVPKPFSLVNNSNGHATLTLHPDYLAAGTYNISVTVNDGNSITTRQFTVTVNDVNPNTNVYVRFQYADTIGKPWNNITGLTAPNLTDASGKKTNISISLKTSWFATYNQGPTTGDNSGIFPDAVLKDYYYFGIYGGPETVDTKITGLDTSRLYNLTFFAASNFSGTTNNGSTIYTVGNKSDTLAVQENTENTAAINNVKPASDGSIMFTMSKNSDADAGYINALIISSLYDDGTNPANPVSLIAENIAGSKVQLSWNDVAYNESGYKIYRSLASNKNFTVVGKTLSEATSFIDTTAIGNVDYLYKVQAFNTHGNSNYTNTVTITTLNRVPELNAITDVVLSNNKTATINIKAKDDSNDHIILSVTGLPLFATFTDNGNGTGKISIIPSVNDLGSFNITVTATDNSNASDSTTFNILIKNPNISSTYLSFSDGVHSIPKPWNLIGPYPSPGISFANLKDDSNKLTGITVTYKNGFQGIIESGMQPVDGVGIYPNAIIRTAVFEGSSKNDTIKISGLGSSKAYNFIFFNSHDDGLDGSTNFTIGSTTVNLNATDNINNTVQINGIKPDATGIINIIVSKAPGAVYAFISSLIIQSYDTSYVNLAPANLLVKNITRNSISLGWQHTTSLATKYEVWRAADGEKNYKLIATIPANISSYTDLNLTGNKSYNYSVRAVFGAAYSDFSNIVSASTYAYNVYLNFTLSNDALLPWNNLNAVPQTGYAWNNFFDEKGMITGTGLQLNTEWAGIYSDGMNPLNNSGIFPDTVMIDSYGLFPGQTATFQVTGLNLNMKYDFTFFASSQAYGDVNTAYTINGKTTLLNASLNVNGTQTIYGVKPDKYGAVTITVAPATSTSQYGIIGALIIGGYSPSSSDVIPVLPETPGAKFASSAKQTVVEDADKKDNNNDGIKAFPNPFHNYLILSVSSQNVFGSGKIQVIMYDAKGNPVYKNEFVNAQKENSITIITNGNLAAGIYTIVVINADTKKIQTLKLIKR